MIAELLIILSIFGIGGLLLKSLGMKGWAVIPVGFMIGSGLVVILLHIQALFGLGISPVAPLGLLLLSSLAFWISRKDKNKRNELSLVHILYSVVLISLLVTFFYQADLVKYHFDSIRYLITGSLLYAGNFDAMSMNLVVKRFSAVSALHSLGGFSGDIYLRSFTPIMASSILGTLYWLTQQVANKKFKGLWLIAIAISGPIILLTSHSFLWHSFYINGHLLFSGYLLLAFGIIYLLLAKKWSDSYKKLLLVIASISLASLVLTRGESTAFVLVGILPVLLSGALKYSQKLTLAASISSAIIIQQFFVISSFNSINRSIPDSSPLFIFAALVLMVLAFLSNKKLFKKYSIQLIWLAEITLWVALLLFYLMDASILTDSLRATIANVFNDRGNWGKLPIMLIVTGGILMAIKQTKDLIIIRYPLTTFIPIAFLLAYLRDGAYRVGVTDSLNRMLMHIVPLVIFFIILLIISDKYRLKR